MGMESWSDREWAVFYAIFDQLPRCGPGDDESTAKAYALLKGLPDKPRILDAGCGPGAQTMALARLSQGEIWALDNHQPFLDTLRHCADKAGLGGYIRTINQDLCNLDLPPGYFDVIWAEGSIYFYGYEKALRDWRKYFRGEPRFAFSEPNWLEDPVPEDAKRVWAEYPPISAIQVTLERIGRQGYAADYFTLPGSAWTTAYYQPMQAALDQYLRENPLTEPVKTVADSIRREIDDYRKYSRYYGYTFYVCRQACGA